MTLSCVFWPVDNRQNNDNLACEVLKRMVNDQSRIIHWNHTAPSIA